MKELLESAFDTGYEHCRNSEYHSDENTFEEWFESNQTLIDDAIVKYLTNQGKKIVDIDPVMFGGITQSEFIKACEMYMGGKTV